MSFPEPIAIVGMACAFPGARDLAEYWSLIASGRSALSEAPPARLNPEKYGLKTRRGGFLDEPSFDPVAHGVMPSALDDGDAEQFLLLSIVQSALRDARMETLRDVGERSAVIVGRGGYLNDAGELLYMSGEGVEQVLGLLEGIAPELSSEQLGELRTQILSTLPRLTAETLACAIPNLVASRVANRLDCGGASYIVDGACASSLLALDHVVRDLRDGRCDVGIAAGIHLMQKPYLWRAFEQLGALSQREVYAPFDAASDGLVIGEGVGALVLKRENDALRDGDRIYALVRAVGVSSDGRGQGLMAPRREGQVRALENAYHQAQIDPATVSLLEAHGTGTVVGDAVEIDALHEFFDQKLEEFPTCALGSVKSQIGHAMPAAGMAGLIKAALAIHHSALPPTINIETPHPKLQDSSFYINSALRPWMPLVRESTPLPLRAGVNAFGFGGINTHAILEEPRRDSEIIRFIPRSHELFVVAAHSRNELRNRVQEWHAVLFSQAANMSPKGLRDCAFTAWQEATATPQAEARLAIVASSLDDLRMQIESLIEQWDDSSSDRPTEQFAAASNTYWRVGNPVHGKLAVLFPGIGFPGLAGGYAARLAELCLHFPRVRQMIEQAHVACSDDEAFPYSLGEQLFPPPHQSNATLVRIERELAWSPRTLPGMMAANLATWELLRLLKIEPDSLAGFSLGEWSAMVASEAVDIDELMRFMRQVVGGETEFSFERSKETGVWAMIAASPEVVEQELEQIPGIINITIDTSPHQVFIGGEIEAVAQAITIFKSRNVWAQQLPFPAVHTPLASELVERLLERKADLPVRPVRFKLYHGAGGVPYPEAPEEMLDCLFGGICEPVRVRQTAIKLYEDGTRIFVQVGSGGKMLANLRHTFGDLPYEAAALDLDHRGGLEQFLHCAAQLYACGVSMDLEELFIGRGCTLITEHTTVSATSRQLSFTPPRMHADESTLEVMRAAILPQTGAQQSTSNGSSKLEPRPVSHHPIADAMKTMQQFLAVQQQHEAAEALVFARYLEAQRAFLTHDTAAPQSDVSTSDETIWPLLGHVIRHEPGRVLTTRLVLDLHEHTLLQDHSLVRIPPDLADLKPLSERLPTLPMTASLEILSEAASALLPQWKVACCENVEARHWIALESVSQLPIQITASCVRIEVDEVEVAVAIYVEKDGTVEASPALTGSVIMRRELPTAPEPLVVPLGRPCPRPVEDYYHDGPLFHGPRFHVIRKLCAMSDEGIEAILEVPDPQALFASPLSSSPILDAALLDGLGQVVGYPVAFDHWAVFPHKIGRLTRYAETPPVGSPVRCVVRYRRPDARRLMGDVDAFDENGKLWLRITDWLDWRVLWPKEFLTFDFDPRKPLVASPHSSLENEHISCRALTHASLKGVDPDWFARFYLREGEWQKYRETSCLDWLLGRIAAKDAVRDYLQSTRGQRLHPLEIEIGNAPSGKPLVLLPEVDIELSISHLPDEAIAAVSASPVGIDLAQLETRGPEWKNLAFTDQEQQLLGASEEWVLRGWCAKEAAAKAHGLGLASLSTFRVIRVDRDAGEIELCSTNDGTSTRVKTEQDKKRVRALCSISS